MDGLDPLTWYAIEWGFEMMYDAFVLNGALWSLLEWLLGWGG